MHADLQFKLTLDPGRHNDLEQSLIDCSAAQSPSIFSQPGDLLLETIHEDQEYFVVEQGLDSGRGKSSLWMSYINMCKMIIGAGIMALPRCFASFGLLGGTIVLLLVCFLTAFSLTSLTRASDKVGKTNYCDMVGAEFGPGAAVMARVAMLLFCSGYLVIYLIILTDVLVGTDDVPGLIDDFLPEGIIPDAATAPLPSWFFERWFWLSILVWVFLAPLIAPRNLGALSRASFLGVISAMVFACVLTVVAGVAIATNQAADVTMWPVIHPPHCRFSSVVELANLLSTIPVVMTSFSCHFGIHAIMTNMQAYSPKRMKAVVSSSLTTCAAIYILTGISGYILFGSATTGDVMASFEVDDITTILGYNAARTVVLGVKLSNALSLLLTFPLLNWAVRDDIIKMLFRDAYLTWPGYLTLTYGLLVLYWLLGMLGTSMWQMATLLGSTSGVLLCFIFPALLVIHCEDKSTYHWRKATAWLLLCGGVGLGLMGISSVFSGGS